jgi:hypothetical protein
VLAEAVVRAGKVLAEAVVRAGKVPAEAVVRAGKVARVGKVQVGRVVPAASRRRRDVPAPCPDSRVPARRAAVLRADVQAVQVQGAQVQGVQVQTTQVRAGRAAPAASAGSWAPHAQAVPVPVHGAKERVLAARVLSANAIEPRVARRAGRVTSSSNPRRVAASGACPAGRVVLARDRRRDAIRGPTAASVRTALGVPTKSRAPTAVPASGVAGPTQGLVVRAGAHRARTGRRVSHRGV